MARVLTDIAEASLMPACGAVRAGIDWLEAGSLVIGAHLAIQPARFAVGEDSAALSDLISVL